MAGCLDKMTLIALARGELLAEPTAAAEAHLERCGRCAKALAELEVNADLVAEIRDLEQSRSDAASARIGLGALAERVSATLFGGEAPRA
jgi:anti-sigma factor RsiW